MRNGMVGFLGLIAVSASVFANSNFSTDITQTFAAAKQEKKPILIDFFGIWCPPCNQLDETVFETAPFLEKARGFKLLKVDADAKTSWDLKNKYKVGGYPTVIFTDSKGVELYRIVGYRPVSEFVKIMRLAASAQTKNFSNACKSDLDEDVWRCALICGERGDVACASSAYQKLEKKLPKGSVRYLEARTFSVEHSPTEDLKRDGYARLLAEFPTSPKALGWALQYFKAFDGQTELKPKPELVEKVLVGGAALQKDPSAVEFGLSAVDLAEQQADVHARLGETEKSKAAWKQAAVLLEKQAAGLKGPARGFTLERIGCLESAGESAAALKLATDYRVKFPKEFTFHYRAARILNDLKKFPEALPAAQKAFETAYGDNKIRVATLLVEIKGALGDKTGAQKLVADLKKEIQPDPKLQVRTHRYLKALDEALAKVGT